MRIAVTGATGLIGSRLVAVLRERGDEVSALSRDLERARAALGIEAARWDATSEPAPADALAQRDAVVHLAGASVAQRWDERVKRTIRETRIGGTRRLVEGLRAAQPRPSVLVSSSAAGYYGAHGDERLDETAAPGDDFLARLCVEWEAAAEAAAQLGLRVVRLRTGVVLDRHGGALARMLAPFRAGIGGPLAGGRQYVPWIALDDFVGMIVAALDDARWSGPINACAPEPVTNREFAKALGRALRRPAVLPVPGLALRLLYGEMAAVVTDGQRMVPARARELGYAYRHPRIDEALRATLAG